MVKKMLFPVGMFLLTVIFLLSGCDSFYSTSWGTPRKYDPKNIKITVDNIDEWIDAAVGNPDLAEAVTEAVKEKVKNMEDKDPDKAKLQEAGVTLAVEASGLGTILLSNMDTLADLLGESDEEDDSTADAVKDFLETIQNDYNDAGGSKAASNLAEIVEPKGGYGGNGDAPKLSEGYADIAKPSDVSQAIVILLLEVLNQEDIDAADIFEDDFDIESLDIGLTIDEITGLVVIDGDDTSIEAKALAAYLNLLIEDDEGVYDSNDILKSLKDALLSNGEED